jgi:uncharacterized membrane protein
MKTAIIGLALLAFSSQLLSSQTLSTQAVPTFKVTDLGTGNSVAGISNAGIVAALDGFDGAGHAALYWTDGSSQIRDLTLDLRLRTVCGLQYPPAFVFPSAISHNGLVAVTVLTSIPPETNGCVAVYNPKNGGTWTFNRTLGPLGYVTGINNFGQVTGNELYGFQGFGPGCDFSGVSAEAIDDFGQVVGFSFDTLSLQLCTRGVWKVLIPGFGGGVDAMNNRGQIVGAQFSPADQTSYAFLYDMGTGKLTKLGALPGGITSDALSINFFGEITGFSYRIDYSAFFDEKGVMYDLATLIAPTDPYKGHIQFAGNDAHINDRGVIAVSGYDAADGISHVFVLTPIKTK